MLVTNGGTTVYTLQNHIRLAAFLQNIATSDVQKSVTTIQAERCQVCRYALQGTQKLQTHNIKCGTNINYIQKIKRINLHVVSHLV